MKAILNMRLLCCVVLCCCFFLVLYMLLPNAFICECAHAHKHTAVVYIIVFALILPQLPNAKLSTFAIILLSIRYWPFFSRRVRGSRRCRGQHYYCCCLLVVRRIVQLQNRLIEKCGGFFERAHARARSRTYILMFSKLHRFTAQLNRPHCFFSFFRYIFV